MPWRTGPRSPGSGLDELHERLPRAIAARLARAGLAPASGAARAIEPAPTAARDGDDRRDDFPTTSPATFTR